MATDIAFALGAIALFGNRLPAGLRLFLTAFAIADDLGAVFIIAFFYTKTILWKYLFFSIIIIIILFLANLFWIRYTLIYSVMGILLWFTILMSGIHATISGILLAMFIPAKGKYDTDIFLNKVNKILHNFKCEEQSCGYTILLNRDHLDSIHSLELACHDVETPLQRMEHNLHPWVAFLVLPLFALANTGVNIYEIPLITALLHPITLGIAAGLIIGKPLGITLASYIAIKSGIAVMPEEVRWPHIIGASMLGGIGFTMSLFISSLSFSSSLYHDFSRLGILSGSLIAAILGILFLSFQLNSEK